MKVVSVIIPAYNEVQRIARTVLEAVDYFETQQQACEIIVAADGNDGTREAVRELAVAHPCIKVMGSAKRAGKGRGIREAVRMASGDVIGFSDADNKTP